MCDIMINMTRNEIFEAGKKKFKKKIFISRKKKYKFLFKKIEYCHEFGRILFKNDISFIICNKILVLTEN